MSTKCLSSVTDLLLKYYLQSIQVLLVNKTNRTSSKTDEIYKQYLDGSGSQRTHQGQPRDLVHFLVRTAVNREFLVN